jgi:hypothetical protein
MKKEYSDYIGYYIVPTNLALESKRVDIDYQSIPVKLSWAQYNKINNG